MSSSQINDLGEFLSKHNAKTLNKPSTHTRIGDTALNIYGGNYCIEKDELPLYYRLYYESIFVKGRKEYLTESQPKDGTGPILIDFDFRYEYDVTERIHTIGHIQDVVQLYLEELKELLIFREKTPFPIFIMEKPHVNRVVDKNLTKDGIHMIIGIQMDHTLQQMLRERIMAKLSDIWELPLTNDWNGVLDEGISKGTTNWQMYGSQKPGNEAYRLTYQMIAEIDPADNEFMTVPKSIKDFDLSKNFHLLSAQYSEHVKFDINPKIEEQYNKLLSGGVKRAKKSGGKGKVNLVLDEEEDEMEIQLGDIVSPDILKKVVDNIMSTLKVNEQFIKETHEYTQVLPSKYYEPGSHLLNRQVAFALKHTDERLFLSWIMLRSKASDFEYDTIPQLHSDWKYKFNKKSDGVTRRSIMYWAKQDAFEEYERVKRSTINSYVEDTIFAVGDWDYAMVLYHMFKDRYVCSSITNKTWYVFNNHRWEQDEGLTLRMAISKDLFQLYDDKQCEYLADMQSFKDSEKGNDDYQEIVQKKIKKIAEICIKLKKTGDKNNIMREAMEIFFDRHFIKNMDADPYLMCFTNGVVDFKTKEFRQGYPQDYITKTTGIPYVPFNPEANAIVVEELLTFMDQLFPQKELCRYMWDHLAATLIGIKKEHAFNIYRGSGSNGKSILTELMSQALGEYKGTVPITLVTEKRNAIGGTSSEIIQLKGVRYAVMQEPSKDAIINEGIMKELTGGDPIQARALFCSSEIFIPQFSLVVCTNALFEIKSNDDGTWRRMKLVDFISKFVSDGEHHTDDTTHVFPKDKGLKEKLPSWAIVFISMLVKRAFETDGEVVDCDEVKAASKKYRDSQDCFAGFISDNIEKNPGSHVGKKLLNGVFGEWFRANFSGRKVPKLMELEEAMDKKYEKRFNKSGAKEWLNIKIKSEEADDNALDPDC